MLAMCSRVVLQWGRARLETSNAVDSKPDVTPFPRVRVRGGDRVSVRVRLKAGSVLA